jgi:hypothetical protein
MRRYELQKINKWRAKYRAARAVSHLTHGAVESPLSLYKPRRFDDDFFDNF